jgi:hypothetical protein
MRILQWLSELMETRLRLMLPRIFVKRRRIGRVDLAVVVTTNLHFGLMVQSLLPIWTRWWNFFKPKTSLLTT